MLQTPTDQEKFLFGRINYERTPGRKMRRSEFRFQTMLRMLAELGDPHLQYPIIHVAGTKGKGSVSTMISSVLTHCGYATGLYTSPHLQSVEERFRIHGRSISHQEFSQRMDCIRPIVEMLDIEAESDEMIHRPTFFEIATVLAFDHFAASQVDAAVFEVGLGGRLDSTNVCQSNLAVITSISLDHTAQLGDTLEKIAFEKAGIIKRNTPVINGESNQPARDEIKRVAELKQAPLFQIGNEFDCKIGKPDAALRYEFSCSGVTESMKYELANLRCGLSGKHQARNACIAVATLKAFETCGFKIDDDNIRDGLMDSKLDGRFQGMRLATKAGGTKVVLDIAHNPASIEALVADLGQLRSFRQARNRILVFASSRGKNVGHMLKTLGSRFDHFVLTRFVENPRAIPVEQMREICSEFIRPAISPGSTTCLDDTPAALRWIRATCGPADFVCVTGSSFLVAEFIGNLNQGNPHLPT